MLDDMPGWRDEPTVSAVSETDNDILALEPEVQEKADDGLNATLHWLQTRPVTDATRYKWLLRLLMARVAEQKGKNELALHPAG